ncbi:MAG: chloride channel protein [Acidobacteria bacterium]|nr:chloride channel protein [Acidobacteriota bacterium]
MLDARVRASDGHLRGGSRLAVGALQLAVPAVLIGAGAGLAAVAFRWLITAATIVFTGVTDYSGVAGHPPNHWVPWLGAGFVCLVPVIGGLLYGPLVAWLAPEARGHGVPEVMLAVAKRGGRIRPRVAVVKALASAVCIGSGGSVGREGPIIQIGSALGSTIARLTRSPEDRVRALVACGAAGGIAATFNAPIAGVFFALELLLRDFAARSFGAVMLASITASIVGRSMLGNAPFLHLPTMGTASPWEYALFAILGLLAGALGMGFTRVLYLIEDTCDRLWRGPEWLRPVVGGVLIGGILLVLPQMYGVGYPVLDAGVRGRYAIGFLLILLVGKVIATSLTLGVGGSGGVFAPSLFVGAMFGEAFGLVVSHIDPSLAGQASVFALVGMGAVLAGTTRAPITAGIMLFELTGDYNVILPLLLAIILATATSRLLGKDTIYTLKLRRRGIDLDVPAGAPVLHTSVRELMEPPLPEIAATELPQSVATAMLLSGRRSLAVTGAGGERLGVVTMRSLSEALGMDDDAGSPRVADLLERTATVAESDTLASVLESILDAGEQDGLPVADEHGNWIGWLSQEAVLRALAEHTATIGR